MLINGGQFEPTLRLWSPHEELAHFAKSEFH